MQYLIQQNIQTAITCLSPMSRKDYIGLEPVNSTKINVEQNLLKRLKTT